MQVHFSTSSVGVELEGPNVRRQGGKSVLTRNRGPRVLVAKFSPLVNIPVSALSLEYFYFRRATSPASKTP
jgi:hypothetical protein